MDIGDVAYKRIQIGGVYDNGIMIQAPREVDFFDLRQANQLKPAIPRTRQENRLSKIRTLPQLKVRTTPLFFPCGKAKRLRKSFPNSFPIGWRKSDLWGE